ncbi:MAG: polysaccharide deacetylase [Acidobacteriota bacterium]|nr:polysaccharide deacetylase [Acidobacteriota bacterium]
MIIIPLAAAVAAAVGNASLKKNIEELKARVSTYEGFKNDGREFSTADFYALMERLGVKKEDFFLLLYDKDPDILNVLDNYIDKQAPEGDSENKADEQAPAAPAAVLRKKARPTAVPAFEPGSPAGYANLYQDLYAEKYADETAPRYKNDKGHIYLTFDDGPSKHTTNILNYLKKHEVTATFFVVPGKNSARLLNMILENGHAIGVHSASHDYYEIYSSVEAFLADFKKAYDLIYKQTGIKPEIFRFPGGSNNSYNFDVRDNIIAEMTRRGFVYFDWNVDSKDYADATWTQMYNTVLSEVADNTAKGRRSIILLHDRPGGMNTVLVIEDIVIALLNDPNGYRFGKLDRYVKPIQF